MKACVVGSGPSGVACAWGLIEAGAEVTLIDVGRTIEPALADLTERTAAVEPEAFLARVRGQRAQTAKAQSIPAKMPFGSDYVFRPIAESRFELAPGTRLMTSLAKGGLSSAWGATVGGLAGHDIDDWPVGMAELGPCFRDLAALVEVAGDDALDAFYGGSLGQSESFPLGGQGSHVLERARASGAELAAHGLHCGRARVAVGRRYASNGDGCVSCGLCMHGCPYNAIFSAADVLPRLEQAAGFTYLGGRFVRRFRETDGAAEVQVRDLGSDESAWLRFDRVFLACGVLATTSVVARSLDMCDHTFVIKDSTKYLFPFLTDRRVRGASREPANTLAQIYVESAGQESTPRTAHGQLYGYNDLLLEPARKILGDYAFKLAPLGGFLLERVMIGMLYLHSDDSGTLELVVRPEEDGAGLGRVSGLESARSAVVAGEFLRRLTAARRQLGGRPLALLASKNPPGLSQHFGSSLPMKREPDRFATDLHGRPWRCQRVHCVDGTVLPTIPGTPTALVLMANALRIARGSVSL